MSSHPGDVTQLLLAWSNGDRDALEDLLPVVYGELRHIAARYFLHERPGHTLQATGLVHEAYFKLVDQQRVRWQNRAQFFGVAAQLMRRILVDHARKRHAVKRDGGVQITLDDGVASAAARNLDLLALDGALDELMALDPRAARVVEMRFFGGLSIEEAAFALGLSSATVEREWATARAWLRTELS